MYVHVPGRKLSTCAYVYMATYRYSSVYVVCFFCAVGVCIPIRGTRTCISTYIHSYPCERRCIHMHPELRKQSIEPYSISLRNVNGNRRQGRDKVYARLGVQLQRHVCCKKPNIVGNLRLLLQNMLTTAANEAFVQGRTSPHELCVQMCTPFHVDSPQSHAGTIELWRKGTRRHMEACHSRHGFVFINELRFLLAHRRGIDGLRV
jgi:hypothetical protein